MVRAKAVVVDIQQLLIYTEDGQKIEIPQGDPRINEIVEKALPVIAAGGVAEIDLGVDDSNAFRDFEEKSTGVRFFSVLKRKVASLIFGRTPEQARIEENLGLTEVVKHEDPKPEALPQHGPDVTAAVKEIIQHAKPASDPSFEVPSGSSEHTIVAVVGEGDDAKAIAGVEMIENQFKHASKLGSSEGVKRLLERLGAIIDKRRHSVEDVLRFMERGDLPVADDGSILAYKRLYRSVGAAKGKKDVYVDPHTRNVPQRVGSYVCVAEALVDMDRSRECSNGLHIGRRGYMGSFSGDVLTLCKVDPEDVITVPHRDPNKVRVKGYHIIAELSQEQFSQICKDKPMTTDRKGESLLARAIRGEHIGRIERVEITGQQGQGVVITPLEKDGRTPAKGKVTAPNATAIDDPRNVKAKKAKGTAKPADEVLKTTQAHVPVPVTKPTPAAPAPTSGRAQKAMDQMNIIQASSDMSERRKAALELMEMKKSAKVGWKTLGISTEQVETITSLIENQVDPVKIAAQALATPSNNPRQQKAQELFDVAANTKQPMSKRRQALADLRELKASARVGWDRLNLTQSDVQILINVLGQEAAKAQTAPIKGTAPKKAAKQPIEKKKTYPATNAGVARKLFDEGKLDELKTFKKERKKSWQQLGFSDKEARQLSS